jgi:hypothetical protein
MKEKAKEVGRFIFRYMEEHDGRPPTTRDISGAVTGAWTDTPMSLSMVKYNLKVLAKAGIIEEINDGEPRNIRIVGAVYIAPTLPVQLRVDNDEGKGE